MLKLFKPYVSYRAIWNVVRVLLGSQLAEGPQVKAFEDEFAYMFNLDREKVVALNSGTSALELAYDLAGIKKGDEVITPVLTCTATNIPLIRRGAKIVFADIAPDLNVDIDDIKTKITKKTKAIVFVHFGGNNRGLRELLELCEDKHITLIEDAAQAVGSAYWGEGDFTCVSLQAIKTLTSGDGGILIARKKEDALKARKLRWFGYDREAKQKSGDIDLDLAGYKYHMNDISASIGRGNLKSIRNLVWHRKIIGEIYKSYGLFAHAWLAGGFTSDYEKTKKLFADNGIEIGQHHYRNDKYTLFGGKQKKLSIMNALEKRYFFVPLHNGVNERQAHKIGRLYQNYVR